MKLAIIGTNFVCDAAMQAIKLFEDIEVVVINSGRLENAKAFADKYNVKNYTDNYQDLLNYDIDAVYLAVPNALHKDIALFFLNNKIAVFCEKPMASNYDEVVEMIEAAKANNTLLMEGLVPIYTDATQAIKDNLNRIGNIRRAVLSMNQYSSRYDAFREGEVLNAFKPELSNGSIMDIGVYPISLALKLFGKPRDVYASAFVLSSKVDGSGTVILNYDGFDVVVMHSKISNQVLVSEIQGEDGVIQIDHVSIPADINLYLNKQEKENIYLNKDTVHMYYEWKYFLDAYKNNKIEVFDKAFELSLNLHEILTKVRKQTNVVFPADKK